MRNADFIAMSIVRKAYNNDLEIHAYTDIHIDEQPL